jgi:NADPH:quinone reductase-like Zn-dependent oxidoreductase
MNGLPTPTVLSATMRAFFIEELAHPSKIALSYNAPEPVPGRNQVLVDVFSAGLNFFDVSGVYKRMTLKLKKA